MASIDTIPLEIFQEILIKTCSDGDRWVYDICVDSKNINLPPQHRLLQVSRKWNTTTDSTSRLWSSIRVDLGAGRGIQRHKAIHFIREAVRRSGGVLLDISIPIYGWYNLAQTFLAEAHRWRTLTLSRGTGPTDLDWLARVQHKAPMLHGLSIDDYMDWRREFEAMRSWLALPSIRRLSLGGFPSPVEQPITNSGINKFKCTPGWLGVLILPSLCKLSFMTPPTLYNLLDFVERSECQLVSLKGISIRAVREPSTTLSFEALLSALPYLQKLSLSVWGSSDALDTAPQRLQQLHNNKVLPHLADLRLVFISTSALPITSALLNLRNLLNFVRGIVEARRCSLKSIKLDLTDDDLWGPQSAYVRPSDVKDCVEYIKLKEAGDVEEVDIDVELANESQLGDFFLRP